MSFDHHVHIFHSPQFQNIVDEAVRFFSKTPVLALPLHDSFAGSGVYGIYYVGNFDVYAEIRDPDRPIYVGKAVPPGWRSGRSRETDAPVLYGRLREHARSISQAANLRLGDFRCRFMILDGLESDLVVPVEAALIRRYMPLWNSVIDGFGNHDPGSGRYNQAKSEWDVLHPGRPWAERLAGDAPRLEVIREKAQRYSSRIP